MANRLVASVFISVLSLLVVTDAQMAVPVGGLEEVSPQEMQRVMTGMNPSQQAQVPGRGIRTGMRSFNTAPFPFAQRQLMRRPGQMQFRFNIGIPPGIPTRFNMNPFAARRAIPRNPAGMIPPSFNRNAMRIAPMRNTIRSFRQQQFQQEALRRSQLAQRFRPFFNATPPRFGVATVQQANAIIQQNRAPPNFQQDSQVDLSNFPNFGTNNGNEIGNQLINQLMSFQQVSAVVPGQNPAVFPQQQGQNALFFPQQPRQNAVVFPHQMVPRVMPTQSPVDQQLLDDILNRPSVQLSEPRGQFLKGQDVRSTQNFQQVTGNNVVPPTFSNTLPVPQSPFTSIQGFNTQTENTVPGSATSGINQPQWSFQTGNAPAVLGGQDASQLSQTLTQTGSEVQNNQVLTDTFSQGSTIQSGQIFTDQSGQVFTGQSGQGFTNLGSPPSKQTASENTPVQFDKQVTIFHPGNKELCYRGRNLSPDLLKWVVNILTLRMQRPDGDALCRDHDSYTIQEIIEMEKEFLASGIDPHSAAAFQVQPDVVNIGNTGAITGTATASNMAPDAQLPTPPADALMSMSFPSQGSLPGIP